MPFPQFKLVVIFSLLFSSCAVICFPSDNTCFLSKNYKSNYSPQTFTQHWNNEGLGFKHDTIFHKNGYAPNYTIYNYHLKEENISLDSIVFMIGEFHGKTNILFTSIHSEEFIRKEYKAKKLKEIRDSIVSDLFSNYLIPRKRKATYHTEGEVMY